MSILGLVCLLLAIVAALMLVLFLLQRAELRALSSVALQTQRIATSRKLEGKVEVTTDLPSVQSLASSINHLVARAVSGREKSRRAPALFADLGDRVHEAVLIYTEGIIYSNRQFASFVGVDRVDLVGRRLEDLVAPEYSQLVADVLRKRMNDEVAPERFEVEIVGMQGQVSVLELTSATVEYEDIRALLITGVEVVQTQQLRALTSSDAALVKGEQGKGEPLLALPAATSTSPAHYFALQSLVEAVLTTNLSGHIDYMNPAAEALLGVSLTQAQGRLIEEVTMLVDINDRRLLAEPVRQAASGGSPVSLGRRALLLQRPAGGERSIELAASPLRNDAAEIVGAAVVLHDVTEQRGMQRQMSYQATHDALTGLVNRREFQRRLEEAIDSAQRGDSTHVLCYVDLDRFKHVNDTSGHL
ncbi:MAG: PAS domain S-box protein, partial [Pseudomonadales bacterium]|nr:PAS domain S-box protein [Pseudomonadales bacterium]